MGRSSFQFWSFSHFDSTPRRTKSISTKSRNEETAKNKDTQKEITTKRRKTRKQKTESNQKNFEQCFIIMVWWVHKYVKTHSRSFVALLFVVDFSQTPQDAILHGFSAMFLCLCFVQQNQTNHITQHWKQTSNITAFNEELGQL